MRGILFYFNIIHCTLFVQQIFWNGSVGMQNAKRPRKILDLFIFKPQFQRCRKLLLLLFFFVLF